MPPQLVPILGFQVTLNCVADIPNFFSISAQYSFFAGRYHCLHLHKLSGCVGSGCATVHPVGVGVALVLMVLDDLLGV
jgi:hypothetical protein